MHCPITITQKTLGSDVFFTIETGYLDGEDIFKYLHFYQNLLYLNKDGEQKMTIAQLVSNIVTFLAGVAGYHWYYGLYPFNLF